MNATHLHRLLAYLACSALYLTPSIAHADITTLQSLSFGEFIVTNNDVSRNITINADGSYSFSNIFIMLEEPQAGRYEINGLPANMNVSLSATQLSPLNGAQNLFTMQDFTIQNTNTDGDGVMLFQLGASARTSGNGLAYTDQSYSGIIQVEVNF